MSYGEALGISWSVTWRLAAGDAVLLLLLAMLAVVFGSHGPNTGSVFFLLYAFGEWLVVWPFVVRRALAPGAFVSSDLAKRFVIQYRPAVLLGIAIYVISLVPVFAIALLARPVISAETTAITTLSLFLIRLFIVLPLAVQLLARRVVAA